MGKKRVKLSDPGAEVIKAFLNFYLLEFITVTLANKIMLVSGVQFHNTSSVNCIMCSPPQVKSPVTFFFPGNDQYIQVEKMMITSAKVRVYAMLWNMDSGARLIEIKCRFYHLLSGFAKMTGLFCASVSLSINEIKTVSNL